MANIDLLPRTDNGSASRSAVRTSGDELPPGTATLHPFSAALDNAVSASGSPANSPSPGSGEATAIPIEESPSANTAEDETLASQDSTAAIAPALVLPLPPPFVLPVSVPAPIPSPAVDFASVESPENSADRDAASETEESRSADAIPEVREEPSPPALPPALAFATPSEAIPAPRPLPTASIPHRGVRGESGRALPAHPSVPPQLKFPPAAVATPHQNRPFTEAAITISSAPPSNQDASDDQTTPAPTLVQTLPVSHVSDASLAVPPSPVAAGVAGETSAANETPTSNSHSAADRVPDLSRQTIPAPAASTPPVPPHTTVSISQTIPAEPPTQAIVAANSETLPQESSPLSPVSSDAAPSSLETTNTTTRMPPSDVSTSIPVLSVTIPRDAESSQPTSAAETPVALPRTETPFAASLSGEEEASIATVSALSREASSLLAGENSTSASKSAEDAAPSLPSAVSTTTVVTSELSEFTPFANVTETAALTSAGEEETETDFRSSAEQTPQTMAGAGHTPAQATGASEFSSANPPPAIDRQRIVETVSHGIQSAQHTGQAVQIRLDPPDLGRLQIDVALRNGQLTARLEAESAAGHRVLSENLQDLRDHLSQQGIQVDRIEVVQTGSRGETGNLATNSHSFRQPERQAEQHPAPPVPRFAGERQPEGDAELRNPLPPSGLPRAARGKVRELDIRV